MGKILYTLLALSFALPFQVSTAQQHETKRLEPKHSKLTFVALDQSLHNMAAEYQQEYGRIPRAAIYDIAFPNSPEEFTAMNQQAVLLITVVTQDSAELPCKRIYLHVEGQEDKELVVLRRYFSRTDKDPTLLATVGPYREDLLCLIPIATILSSTGQLLLDFRIHRAGFVLDHLPLPAPPEKFLVVDKNSRATHTGLISQEALEGLLQREFPDFESAHFEKQPFQN